MTSGHSHAKSDTPRRRPSILGQRIIVAKVRRFSHNGCGKTKAILLIVCGFRTSLDVHIHNEEGKPTIVRSTRWFMRVGHQMIGLSAFSAKPLLADLWTDRHTGARVGITWAEARRYLRSLIPVHLKWLGSLGLSSE